MTVAQVTSPFETFIGLNGSGINNGKVYVGVAGQDPETNPTPVFWDEAATQLAAQPLTLIGGYIYRSGSPAVAYATLPHSIRVRDRNNVQVYYEPNATAGATMLSDLSNLKAGTVFLNMDNAEPSNEGPYYKQILIDDHDVDMTQLGGLFGGVLRFIHRVGGVLMRGYRITLQSILIHDELADQAENQFVAGTFQARGEAAGAFGGTNSNWSGAKGGLFGANSFVGTESGYTNVQNTTAHEFNSALGLGSSVAFQSVIQVVELDRVQGTEVSCLISIGGAGGTPGYVGLKHGILFGNQHSGNPVAVNGTLIGTYDSPISLVDLECANGIDFTAYDITGFVFKSRAFSVSATGSVEIGKAATAGQVQIDLHSSGTSNDYDVRLAVTGGSASDGQGILTVVGAEIDLPPIAKFGVQQRLLLSGSGSPEGSVTAGPGSIYTSSAGGVSTTLYVKRSGAGNTGWFAVA